MERYAANRGGAVHGGEQLRASATVAMMMFASPAQASVRTGEKAFQKGDYATAEKEYAIVLSRTSVETTSTSSANEAEGS